MMNSCPVMTERFPEIITITALIDPCSVKGFQQMDGFGTQSLLHSTIPDRISLRKASYSLQSCDCPAQNAHPTSKSVCVHACMCV